MVDQWNSVSGWNSGKVLVEQWNGIHGIVIVERCGGTVNHPN